MVLGNPKKAPKERPPAARSPVARSREHPRLSGRSDLCTFATVAAPMSRPQVTEIVSQFGGETQRDDVVNGVSTWHPAQVADVVSAEHLLPDLSPLETHTPVALCHT